MRAFTACACALVFVLSATPTYACPGHFQRRDVNATHPPAPTYSVVTRIKPAAATARVAITNVRVFDGYNVLPPSTVFVNGEIISGPLDDLDQIIDGNNGILLPGLFDAHAHPGNITDLETLSSYGVTTVLNMNCQDYEFCSSMRGQTGLTSFFTAGYSAKAPGSPHALAVNAPLNRLISNPAQAPLFVQESFDNGSDWLKIVSEHNGVDQATQDALVLNAHAIGKKTMTHAADYASYIMAILSKTDGPQHVPLDGVLNSSMVSLMYRQRQFATPTINVFEKILSVPAAAAALGGNPNITFATAFPLIKQSVMNLHRGGIPILAGTDATPPYSGVQIPFGTTLHDELYYLTEAGLTSAEALRAATMNAALAHNIAGRGFIEIGYQADLVLLQPHANPFVSINDTRKIAHVWIGGLEYTQLASS